MTIIYNMFSESKHQLWCHACYEYYFSNTSRVTKRLIMLNRKNGNKFMIAVFFPRYSQCISLQLFYRLRWRNIFDYDINVTKELLFENFEIYLMIFLWSSTFLRHLHSSEQNKSMFLFLKRFYDTHVVETCLIWLPSAFMKLTT